MLWKPGRKESIDVGGVIVSGVGARGVLWKPCETWRTGQCCFV